MLYSNLSHLTPDCTLADLPAATAHVTRARVVTARSRGAVW